MTHLTATPVNIHVGLRGAARLALVGEPAWQALSTPSAWTVLAVFRRSFYCLNPDGAVVCVGVPAIGAGPLNALCEPRDALEVPLSRLRPGLAAQQTAGVFWIAGWYGLALGGVRVWHPAPPATLPGPDRLVQGLQALSAACDGDTPPEGLGVLIPHLARSGSAPQPDDMPADAAVARASLPGVRAVVEWLASCRGRPDTAATDPPDAVIGLVGLGTGLTPAGDDFLAGTMIALHGLGRPELARRLAGWLWPRAQRRTHHISLAHLRCAAGGEGAAFLHDVLASVTMPGAPALPERLAGLARLGHSSGWDGLAGAVAAFAAFAGRPSGQ